VLALGFEPFALPAVALELGPPAAEVGLGAFYGCRATRPPEVNDLADPDDPDEFESLIEAVGATPAKYDARLKCCGFPTLMMNKQNSLKLAGNAVLSAEQAGVDALVTPCPLCHFDLDAYQPEAAWQVGQKLGVPVLHLPQLVAMAVGVPKADLRLTTHIVRPTGALAP
jgi:succinate dehydrogenase / fumarate reductase cytochrome b subunit